MRQSLTILAVASVVACGPSNNQSPLQKNTTAVDRNGRPIATPGGQDPRTDPDPNDQTPSTATKKGPLTTDTLAVRTPELLPFSVRLRKLAYAFDIDLQDARLDPYQTQNTQLGDHNYALGVSADGAWSASKILAWSTVTLDLCQNFPANDLVELAQRALGRDGFMVLLEIQEELDNRPTPIPEQRNQLACASILSCGEFLLR